MLHKLPTLHPLVSSKQISVPHPWISQSLTAPMHSLPPMRNYTTWKVKFVWWVQTSQWSLDSCFELISSLQWGIHTRCLIHHQFLCIRWTRMIEKICALSTSEHRNTNSSIPHAHTSKYRHKWVKNWFTDVWANFTSTVIWYTWYSNFEAFNGASVALMCAWSPGLMECVGPASVTFSPSPSLRKERISVLAWVPCQ